MHVFDVDVAVAGAGPAGSCAAFVLARAGRRVLLVDSKEFPRDKPCGDLLGTEAVATLAALGLDRATLAGALPLAGAVLHGPAGTLAGGDAVREAKPGGACVLPRKIFDARLADCARDAGAAFHRGRVAGVLREKDGRIVGLRTSTGDIRARITVGAEGWGSPVARALEAAPPPPGYAALTVRAYAAGIPELERRMHFFINRSGDGYGWVFPVAPGRANVGFGFITGEPGSGNLLAAFERFAGPSSPAHALLGDCVLETSVAWPIPLAWRPGRFTAPGAFIAGDAARLASPLSGSGIYHALTSGSGAARFALRALEGDEAAGLAYGRWLHARFARRSRVERFVHRFAGTPGRVEPWLRLARVVPGAGGALSRALLQLG